MEGFILSLQIKYSHSVSFLNSFGLMLLCGQLRNEGSLSNCGQLIRNQLLFLMEVMSLHKSQIRFIQTSQR